MITSFFSVSFNINIETSIKRINFENIFSSQTYTVTKSIKFITIVFIIVIAQYGVQCNACSRSFSQFKVSEIIEKNEK